MRSADGRGSSRVYDGNRGDGGIKLRRSPSMKPRRSAEGRRATAAPYGQSCAVEDYRE